MYIYYKVLPSIFSCPPSSPSPSFSFPRTTTIPYLLHHSATIMIRTHTRTSSLYSVDDPLALALRPPPLETDYEREQRIAAEIEAKRISDHIDEELRLEREARKRRANVQVKVRICLLPSSSFPPRPPSCRFVRYSLAMHFAVGFCFRSFFWRLRFGCFKAPYLSMVIGDNSLSCGLLHWHL